MRSSVRKSSALYSSFTVYDLDFLADLVNLDYRICKDIWKNQGFDSKRQAPVVSGKVLDAWDYMVRRIEKKRRVGKLGFSEKEEVRWVKFVSMYSAPVKGFGLLKEEEISFIEELKGFLEKLYLMEILDSRIDLYAFDEDNIIKSNIMYTLTKSFVGSSSKLLEYIQGVVEGGEKYENLDMFVNSLQNKLSWGNRRLHLWKMWGGFGISRRICGSEKVRDVVDLYLLSREVLEERMFWLQESR